MNSKEQPVSQTIIELATTRGNTKTICPSEVARKLWPDDWLRHMPEVRACALALRDMGRVRIMQKDTDISGDQIKGPIRIQII